MVISAFKCQVITCCSCHKYVPNNAKNAEHSKGCLATPNLKSLDHGVVEQHLSVYINALYTSE